MVEFLIESGLPSSDVLRAEATRQGHQVHFWNNKQILTHNWDLEFHKVEKAVWGSCNTVKFMNRWTETLTDFKIFRRQHYSSYWTEYVTGSGFHQGFAFTTLGTMLFDAEYCGDNDTFGDNGLFIAPDTNDKLFKGFVAHSSRDIADLLKELPPETLIVYAPAREILREWRMVIHNGKVVTGSLYKKEGTYSEETEKFIDHLDPRLYAEEIAKKPFPGLPNMYTMDIGLEADGDTYSLIEIGSANCSGYYSCDPYSVVHALAEETEKLFIDD